MIRENQRLLNRLHRCSDAAIAFCAMLAAYWVRFHLLSGTQAIPFVYFVRLAVAAAALGLLTFEIMGLYESYRSVRFYREAARLTTANLLDTGLLMAALFLLHLDDMSRWMLAIYCVLDTGALLGKRACLRLVLRRYRRLGYNQKHVLVVGSGAMAREYLRRIRTDANLGFLADGYVADAAWDELPCLGGYQDLERLLDEHRPDEVVVALEAEDVSRMGQIIHACEKTGTKASVIPSYAAYIPSNPQVDNVDGLPMFNLRRVPLDNFGNAFLKRSLDIAGSLFLIVLFSPVMLLAAVGVKLSSPGPVIFRQERVGRNKRTFNMYKFRSMRVNPRQQTAWTTCQDDRRTKFGAFIRKCSIDELPQFFNVLKGDMSLVGPRPELPHFVEQFKEEIPRYMVKHQVRPGITGWAQVNGLRGDTSIHERIAHDLYYIENWNLFFDVKILLMTLFRLVNREQL